MLRKARIEDADIVAALMMDAIGDIANTLTGASEPEEVHQVLKQLYLQPGNRVSCERIHVWETEGRCAGIMVTYHGSDIERLDQPILERLTSLGLPARLDREAHEDEFYLDAVAVRADCQGQGIGTKLLQAFEQIAEEQGYGKLLLIVDIDNKAAKSLYERLGYVQDGLIMVSGHGYERMVKRAVEEDAEEDK